MSIDDRLREAFGPTDGEWDRAAPAALRAVTARRDRERLLVRGGAVALAAAAAVAVVAVVATHTDDKAGPAPVTPPGTPLPTPSPTPETGEPTSPLDGRWKSRPITAADVRDALEPSGLDRYAGRILAELPATPFRVIWVVHGDGSELEVVSNGDVTVVDEEDLVVTADQVLMSPKFAPGDTVLGWRRLGDGLDLTVISTTEVRSGGVPGEAWLELLYGSVAFRR
jgi:hypothetical protein